MKTSANTAAPITPEVAEAVKIDFYFKCTTLNCTLRASACEKNRAERSKSDALMLTKQSAKCKGCKDFEEQQKATAVSVEEYHSSLSTPPRSSLYNHTAPKPGIHSDWAGRGRNRERIT
jgi:hypothetical protein